jgi:ABC-2 type transport system permease protein
MSDTALVGRQLTAEQKSFWRNPLAAGFTFVFPLMFLLLFGSLSSNDRLPELGNIRFTEFYVPGIITFGVISACFNNLALTLSRHRDLGILKRKRSTPLPTWVLLAGMVLNAVIVALIIAALTTVIGMLVFHNDGPAHPLVVLPIIALGSATFAALGIAVTAMIPNADAGPAVVNVMIFPVLFLSGIFFPVNNDTINQITGLLPVRPFRELLMGAFDPGGIGQIEGRNLAVMVVWALIGALVAVLTFRWEGPDV